jgi:hypothetical protein
MKNPNIKIFAVSGKAQHGKDTFANVLYEELTNKGHRVLLTHYADLLKFICKSLFNWDGQKDEKGRHILQYVGTDVVRNERPDYWVEFVIDMIELFGENWDYVIIPDTRFPNEIDKLKEHFNNVTHLRVVRPNFTSTLTEEQLKHPSETALDNVEPDYVFHNEGTIEDIRHKINKENFLYA